MDEWVCFGSLNYTYVLEGEDAPLWDGGTSRVIRGVTVPLPSGIHPAGNLV